MFRSRANSRVEKIGRSLRYRVICNRIVSRAKEVALYNSQESPPARRDNRRSDNERPLPRSRIPAAYPRRETRLVISRTLQLTKQSSNDKYLSPDRYRHYMFKKNISSQLVAYLARRLLPETQLLLLHRERYAPSLERTKTTPLTTPPGAVDGSANIQPKRATGCGRGENKRRQRERK